MFVVDNRKYKLIKLCLQNYAYKIMLIEIKSIAKISPLKYLNVNIYLTYIQSASNLKSKQKKGLKVAESFQL